MERMRDNRLVSFALLVSPEKVRLTFFLHFLTVGGSAATAATRSESAAAAG